MLLKLITTIFPRIYARTYYAHPPRARYVFLTPPPPPPRLLKIRCKMARRFEKWPFH
jgi:hypothetical protein